MFPVGLLIMLTPAGRDFIWTTSIFLFLQAVVLFIILVHISGTAKAVYVSGLILLISFAVEYIAVHTSFPFGNYHYTDTLYPLISGIPAAITFAWYSVAVSAYLSVSILYPGYGLFFVSFISSVIILSTDIMLEPFASFANGFWIWDSGAVPVQNFISWWILGLCFCLLISLFIPASGTKKLNQFQKKVPFIIIILNILNFMVINTVSGYALLSLTGLFLIIILIFILPRYKVNEA